MRDTVREDTPRNAGAPERHEPWCDRRQHALALAETLGPSGCVGRYVASGSAGGWIADEAPEADHGPRLVVDWQPAEGWNAVTPEEAADLSGLLARLLAEYRRGAAQAAPTPLAASRRLVARERRRTA
ncbi:MAG TPA: hypothetical protein VK402_00860 [Blastococcus sp.]|nr:hypothetical protein [Blastococcus sp.]